MVSTELHIIHNCISNVIYWPISPLGPEFAITTVPEWSAGDFTIVNLFLVDYQTCQNLSKSTIMKSVIDHSDTTATAG